MNPIIAGDDPCSATEFFIPSSNFEVFDNGFNSDSGIEAPPLGGYLGPDTWVKFTATNAPLYLLMIAQGMVDPAIAIYTGTCDDLHLLYNVEDNNCVSNAVPELLMDELIAGEDYYIRIWPQNGSANGDFGLYLGSDYPALPNFEAFADSYIIGDCIQLTDNNGGQQGCAWYQIQIDFSMPFTHDMSAHFGNVDANGADGICLVYQSNGPEFCGISGGGIGSSGIPNSAIFEFDSFSNGAPYFDPPEDHCALGINGDITHPNSIAGPVTLPNIEDGQYHDISFSWDPAGNLYSLSFDGSVILSGSFDFINNCFGGNNLAYWGYTSATGLYHNDQIICPQVVDYYPSTVSHEDIEICDGTSYNGWTDPGLYITTSNEGGCTHQTHTHLSVNPIPDPEYIEKYICEGEVFYIEGSLFSEEGNYTINTISNNGCDSTIHLDLKILEIDLELIADGQLDCTTESIPLTLNMESNYDLIGVDYYWSGPDGNSSSDIYNVSQGGQVSVTLYGYYDDIFCTASSDILIALDTMSPVVAPIDDLNVDCSALENENYLLADITTDNTSHEWYHVGDFVSNEDSILANSPGDYSLLVINNDNSCTTEVMATVTFNQMPPSITLSQDTVLFNCQMSEYLFDPTLSTDIDSIIWTYNGLDISESENITAYAPGVYSITGYNSQGCHVTESAIILEDVTPPLLVADGNMILCDSSSVSINVDLQTNTSLHWSGPQSIANDDLSPDISIGGEYILSATNLDNQCMSFDTIEIVDLGSSPIVSLTSDTINCYQSSANIYLTSDQGDSEYNWQYNDITIGDNENIIVQDAGVYHVSATSITGCTTRDSILISSSFIYPELNLNADTLDCDQESIILNSSINNGVFLSWLSPDSTIIYNNNYETSQAGNYIAMAINEETGCITTDSVIVIDNSNSPHYDLTSNDLNCTKSTVDFSLNIFSDFQSVTWIFPDGELSNQLSPTYDEAGTYQLHIEVDGECDVDTVVVISIDTIAPEYQIDYNDIDCFAPASNIIFNPLLNVATFEITTPTGSVLNTENNNVTDEGIYTVSATGANGCITESEFAIEANLGAPSIQIVDNVTLTCIHHSEILTAQSDDQNLTYTWVDDNDMTLSSSDELSVSDEGLITLYIQNEYGCTNEYPITVNAFFNEIDINIAGEDIDCYQPESQLSFTTDDDYNQINWSSDNGVIDNQLSIDIDAGGWYYLQLVDEYGCNGVDSIFISENLESPELILITADTITLGNNASTADIIVQEISTTDNQLYWTPSDGLSCDDCLTPTLESFVFSDYMLTAFNEYGCVDSLTVNVRRELLPDVIIPNIFSPNNKDGNNDYFTVYGNDAIIGVDEMSIYDRWGSLLFNKKDFPHNEPSFGWDGLFRGQAVIPGVYVYVVKVNTVGGEKITLGGDVTVIR